MSDYSTLKAGIENELLGSWNTVPVFFDNQIEIQNINGLSEYVKLFIVLPDSEAESINGPDTIETGAIMLQIFTELNNGTNRSDELLRELRPLFAPGKTADNGNLDIIRIRTIRVGEMDQYYQVNLEATFLFHYRN